VGRRSIVQKAELSLAAMAQAQGANSAAIGANGSSTVNGAAFTAQATVNFAAPAIKLTTGKRFRIAASISGTASAVDLLCTVTLQRDGVNISQSPTMVSSAGHATAAIAVALTMVLDAPPDGNNHTYSINLVMASGTITVPIAEAGITVQESN